MGYIKTVSEQRHQIPRYPVEQKLLKGQRARISQVIILYSGRMKTSQTSLSALLALVVSLQLTSVRSLTLFVTYPDSANPSTVRLSCMNGANRSENAMFQRNGVDVTVQVTPSITFPGIVEFTMSQELGGSFTCTADGDISNTVTLPVESLTSGSSNSMERTEVIAGSTVSTLTILITTAVVTTLIVMLRRYMARKRRQLREEEEERRRRSEEEDHESVRDNEDKEVALDMEDETPDKP